MPSREPFPDAVQAVSGLSARGRVADAMRLAAELAERCPDDPRARAEVARQLYHGGRFKDAVALLGEMAAAGMTCPEHYAFLLRQRCKAAGIFHPAVPAHPVGWQFTPAVMAKRRARGAITRKHARLLRPKIGKHR